MAKNGWFRFYSETISDRKLRRVSRDTGIPYASVLGIWATILSLANDSPIHGLLLITVSQRIFADDLADMLEIEISGIQSALDAFCALEMLDRQDETYHVTNWDKRQYVDTTSERVRRWRSKQMETDESGECNVTETLQKRNGNAVSNAPDYRLQTTDDRRREEETAVAVLAPPSNSVLLVSSLPHGDELQVLLDATFASRKKPIPAWRSFANITQADAFREAAQQLDGEFIALAKKGLAQERSSRAMLLAWLEGCVRRKKNPQTFSGHALTQPPARKLMSPYD